MKNRSAFESPLAWSGLLVLTTLIWGNAFVAIKLLVERVSPFEVVTLRYAPVALTFAAILLPTQHRQVWRALRSDGWRLALLGLAGAIFYNVFLAWGQTRIAAGTASLIISLNPVFTYILSVVLLGEKLTWQRTLGMAIAFGGLYVIVRWGSGRELTLGDLQYVVITALAPLSWAFYTIASKKLIARHSPLIVTGISMSLAGLLSLAFLNNGSGARMAALTPAHWGAALFLALPCTVVGFTIWAGALKRMPAANVASFIYLVPMFAVTFGHLILDEPVTPALIAGAAILIGGVWLVNRRPARVSDPAARS